MTPEMPSAKDLINACEATWPPAAETHVGAWVIRDGAGGGKRVSAATERWPTTEADLPAAEKAMQGLGMNPLFQIREDDEHLDEMLGLHGYDIIDPVNIWAASIDELAIVPPAPVSAFTAWPILSIMRELWKDGGVGDARLAVMERANGPKTAILGRTDDTPAGVGFVGIHDDIAMVHALHVDDKQRRKGTAQNMVRRAAQWGRENGAKYIGLIVTQGNHAANPLYANLGMHLVGHYHYRIKPGQA